MSQLKLNWKKGIFDSTYSLHEQNEQVGWLQSKSFSQQSVGKLNGKKYAFRTTGTFSQKTDIFDLEDKKKIGEISYSNWMTKAEINFSDRSMHWRYENHWNTRWRLTGEGDKDIQYISSTTSGLINSNTESELEILTGLYINNYYSQLLLLIIFIAFIPIWLTVL